MQLLFCDYVAHNDASKNIRLQYRQITDYKSVSYHAAVWLSPAGGDGIESSSSPAPISPTSISISYGDVGPTNDGLHNSNPWNESIGIGNVSYAKMGQKLFGKERKNQIKRNFQMEMKMKKKVRNRN